MGNPEIRQTVIGDHNLFTASGDIRINYQLPPADAEERRILLQLVDSVKRDWIEGVLERSLNEAEMLDLPKESLPDMVQHPWGRILELPGHPAQPLAAEKKIDEIFHETGRALLILGEPGAGKTVTLLKLASELIGRFENDPMQAAPVVLNLSTWQDKLTLATWIEVELKSKYSVSPGRSRVWLESSRLILLLDGLDEVPADRQPSCVRAINEFDRGLPGIVVCSRLTEYTALPKRLNFKGAVCLQALTVDQVDGYLKTAGNQLASLRQAIREDNVLAELSRSPLMLSILSLALWGAGSNELARQKGRSEERRKQIFGLYVERMFQRKGTAALVFPKEKIIGWLSWLEGKMREQSQSVFLVEVLQPSWLDTRAKRAAYGTVVALCLWLIFGPIFGLMDTPKLAYGRIGIWLPILVGIGLGCWSESPLKNGVISGSISGMIFELILETGLTGIISALIVGLIGGLIGGLAVGSLNHIILVETISWKWNRFWKRTIPGSLVGLIAGLIFGLILGLPYGLSYGLDCGLIVGLILGHVLGLGSGLAGGFTDRLKVGKASPNQGIKLSLKKFFGRITRYLVDRRTEFRVDCRAE